MSKLAKVERPLPAELAALLEQHLAAFDAVLGPARERYRAYVEADPSRLLTPTEESAQAALCLPAGMLVDGDQIGGRVTRLTDSSGVRTRRRATVATVVDLLGHGDARQVRLPPSLCGSVVRVGDMIALWRIGDTTEGAMVWKDPDVEDVVTYRAPKPLHPTSAMLRVVADRLMDAQLSRAFPMTPAQATAGHIDFDSPGMVVLLVHRFEGDEETRPDVLTPGASSIEGVVMADLPGLKIGEKISCWIPPGLPADLRVNDVVLIARTDAGFTTKHTGAFGGSGIERAMRKVTHRHMPGAEYHSAILWRAEPEPAAVKPRGRVSAHVEHQAA